MALMVNVTKAGGIHAEDEKDKIISINADKIKEIVEADEDYVGKSQIIYSDGSTLNVTETRLELNKIINSSK